MNKSLFFTPFLDGARIKFNRMNDQNAYRNMFFGGVVKAELLRF